MRRLTGPGRPWVGLALGMALAGCAGDDPATAGAVPAPAVHLVAVDTFNPATGAQVGNLRVHYGDAQTVVLQPHNVATGEPVASYRQECRFAGGTTRFPAVTTEAGVNRIGGSPTGQILLAIMGIPTYWQSCQEFLPERPLVGERWVSLAGGIEDVIDDMTVLRSADGRLVQRHGSDMLATMLGVTGHAGYEEAVRYVRDDRGRVVARIYGAEAWPADGTYQVFEGIVWDLYFYGVLNGLMAESDALRVAPSAGHVLRLEYDGRGRVAATRRYRDRGVDGQWLTDDDVAADGGLDQYFYEGGRLVRIERGLDPATGAALPGSQGVDWVYAAGALREKRLRDADGRVWQRWRYEITTIQ